MTPTITIALLGALTIVAITAAIYTWSAGRRAERNALRERLDPTLARRANHSEAPSKILREDVLSNIPSLNTLLERFSPAPHLSRLITQAGMDISVVNAFYIMGFLVLSAALLLQWRFGLSRPTAMLGGIVMGTTMPLVYIRMRRKKRLQAFVSQLPAALEMVKSSIHAGHSLDYALEVAVEELPDPIASSFHTVLDEMRLGLTPREALENLNRRVPVEELRFFILAIVLTREVGGNLSEVLTRLAETLRDRHKLRQQVRALSAQGRAAAGLLILIPPGVALVANLLRPGFVDPLFYNPTGRLFLGVAVVFQIVAVLLIRRIVNPRELWAA